MLRAIPPSEAPFDNSTRFTRLRKGVRCEVTRWISSTTDANGKHFNVNGRKMGQAFQVKTSGAQQRLPDCVMTFAYWNKDFLKQPLLLNSQDGKYLPVKVVPRGKERISVRGKNIGANRYDLEADKLDIRLWYNEQGDWVGLESVTESGRVLQYRLE